MEMIISKTIGSGERGILFKDKKFERILAPGRYRFLNLSRRYSVQVYDLNKNLELKGDFIRLLIRDNRAELSQYADIVQLGAREVGVVYFDRKAVDVLGPAEVRVYWKGISEVEIQKFDISKEIQIPAETLRDLDGIRTLRSGLSLEQAVYCFAVPDQNVAILNVDGVRTRVLSPGTYGFWRFQLAISAVCIDTRLQALEVSGQEMLTKDKVTLRVNLTATYKVVDAIKAQTELKNMSEYLYNELQFALREAVGQRSLDELLENKEVLNMVVLQQMKRNVDEYGFKVERVGVKDIILPGEMRVLLNQVVEAEKAAQAQNIKRREETAATRSLCNTARMMEGNPVLMRLKEFEVLEKVSEKIDKLTVFDGLEGVLKGISSLPSVFK